MSVQRGLYRHYKGGLYLVLGVGHDANADSLIRYEDIDFWDDSVKYLGERQVVVYVALGERAEGQGSPIAVRTVQDFEDSVCTDPGCPLYGNVLPQSEPDKGTEASTCYWRHTRPRFAGPLPT